MTDFVAVQFAQKIVGPIVLALDRAKIMSAEDFAGILKRAADNEGEETLKGLIVAFADAALARNDPPFNPVVVDGGKSIRS